MTFKEFVAQSEKQFPEIKSEACDFMRKDLIELLRKAYCAGVASTREERKIGIPDNPDMAFNDMFG